MGRQSRNFRSRPCCTFGGKPMHAEELVDTLGVARSNVSNSIKELQSLNLVQTVHAWWGIGAIILPRHRCVGACPVVWEERSPPSLPYGEFLGWVDGSQLVAQEHQEVRQRIKDTHQFVDTLTTWANEMLKLSTLTLNRILKLGATIQKFLKWVE